LGRIPNAGLTVAPRPDFGLDSASGFGFKDGVSQPGIRGRLSEAPNEFITPRYCAAPTAGDQDKRPELYGKPGQQLVWPGQFLLGEPRQDTENLLDSAKPPDPPTYPEWARRGSYLVCRRLRQDP
jgi:deferrochelatase/peroxidase EfeB